MMLENLAMGALAITVLSNACMWIFFLFERQRDKSLERKIEGALSAATKFEWLAMGAADARDKNLINWQRTLEALQKQMKEKGE